MKSLLLRLLANTIGIFVTAWILGDAVRLDGVSSAVAVAIVLAILNTFLKPILILFTLPATLFSLGLFLFVINAIVIMLADSMLSGFSVSSFWWALIFSLVLSFVNSLLRNFGDEEEKPKPY
jgi:putative membrane protein